MGVIIVFVMERSVYRIIDANFNRAREAVRVIEEYCRFVLNSEPLTARAKQLRHELCGAIGNLDSAKLIASRDTLGDVGVGQVVENQLGRGDLMDSFTAACRRLGEAMRVLTEVIVPVNPSLAQKIEDLRYRAYTLEKDIVLFGRSAEKFKKVRLYVVITSTLPAEIFSITNSCVAGGADCLQLRAKSIEDDKLFAIASNFVKICSEGAVLSIINDRVDIALASGADGIHLGQNDLPVEQAHRLSERPLIIGKSTHSQQQLKAACSEAVSYVSLGPVYATPTKPGAAAVGLHYVAEGVNILEPTGIGHVAIGGIDLENVEDVLKAGAQAVAVCRAVTAAENPKAACRLLKEKIVAFKEK